MFYLNAKGKAYREEKHNIRIRKEAEIRRLAHIKANTPTEEEIQQRVKDKKEEKYRKELEKQGYSDELITTILPTIMNDGN